MKRLLSVTILVAAAASLAGSAETLGGDFLQPYVGMHTGGGEVRILENVQERRVLFFGIGVPLSTPCTGTNDIVFEAPIRKDDSFSKTVDNGGAGGQFIFEDNDPERIPGSIFTWLEGSNPMECVSSFSFEAFPREFDETPGSLFEFIPPVHGDLDCFNMIEFEEIILRSRLGEAGPPDTDDSIDPVDALRILRSGAGLDPIPVPEPVRPYCPALDEQLPNGRRPGDSDCDGDIDVVDALAILRHVARLSPIPQQPGCPRLGAYYSPDN